MNTQSILLLAVVLVLAGLALYSYIRRNRRGSGCGGSCSGCSQSGCPFAR